MNAPPIAVADVRTICCAGTGTIGGGWAAYFLAHGYDVVAWDPAPGAGDRLRHLVDAAWPALTELGLSEGADRARLRFEPVLEKARALSEQLHIDDFRGLRADRWPSTTIPALNLAAAAYDRDPTTGLAVSLELRSALFEHGVDIADLDALALIAAVHHLDAPSAQPCTAIRRDYHDGRERGVQGSPHFFVGDDGFFCPALDLGHDADGHLLARFDEAMLSEFLTRIER